MIEFFAKLFFYFPDTIHLSSSYRIWDVIFSDFFFYCGIPDNTHPAVFLFQGLRLQILLFIQFVATIEKHDNSEECQKLLVRKSLCVSYHTKEVLSTRHEDFEMTLQTTHCLIQILRHNRKATQSILLNFRCLSVLLGLMEKHQAMREKMYVVVTLMMMI